MTVHDISVLDVHLHGRTVGTLTHLQGDRTIFAFSDDYVKDESRPTLSLSFKDDLGGLITNIKPTQRVVPAFFSNLLPEGHLRRYLAERAGINQQREFFLLWVLGQDLPGALSIHPHGAETVPPSAVETLPGNTKPNAYRFSLAGVQLKFSALGNDGKGGGLTIPAEGVGGSWIVKLPSQQFAGVPENEFSMMTLAGMIGMDVPAIDLIDLDAITGLPEGIGDLKGQALAVKRFDRAEDGAIHTEDFAQVFGVFPDEKYGRASYTNIGRVVGVETGNAGVAEFIRRLVFSALIGNGDMHLKNWSMVYPDQRRAALSPAYDLVSTIPYIVGEDTAALTYSRTKRMNELTADELRHLAARARLPEKLVIDTAAETIQRFRDTWNLESKNLPMAEKVRNSITQHAPSIPLFEELAR
ncbi:type II toxin-antitoxin system HipA family toxin [Rhizobium sp. 2YAF20]